MNDKCDQMIKICIDESCPGCGFPELTAILNVTKETIEVYMCGNHSDECAWASKERPEQVDIDG